MNQWTQCSRLAALVCGHRPVQCQEENKGRGRRNSPFFPASLLEPRPLLTSSPAFGLELTPSAPLVPRLQDSTELHHQLPWASSLQAAHRGTSQPPETQEPTPHD